MKELYLPDLGYTYPKQHDTHMLVVEEKNPVDLSGEYPFRDRSFGFRLRQFWFRLFFHAIVLPVCRIRYALRVEGKIDPEVAKNGLVTVCNHVCMWDMLIVHCARPFRNLEYPIWRKNMFAGMKNCYRNCGAIPVPDYQKDGREATVRFHRALEEVLKEKKWLHVYPEGSLWYYYVPIRDFKKTAFSLAWQHDVPVVPLCISFREPKGIYKWFKKDPCATLHIGAPEYPDRSLNKTEAAQDLMERCRTSMMHLIGIESEEENRGLMERYSYER